MASYLLLDLPEALSRSILVEWLHLKHVLRLDSAVTSHVHRRDFLSLAYGRSTTYTIRSCEHTVTELMLKCTAIRGVQLDGVFICENIPYCSELLSPFLALTGAALRWVSCDCSVHNISSTKCQQTLIEVAKVSPNVADLEIQGGQLDHRFETITRAFHRLIYLSLFDVHLTSESLAVALSHCKCLEKLELDVDCVLPAETAVPTLKTIRTYYPCIVTDVVLIAIRCNCAKLETLVMFESVKFGRSTDIAVRAVLQGCPLLRETDVQNAAGFSAGLRTELAGRCNLKSLRHWEWSEMSDELTREVLKVSPNLTVLDCGGCGWLTDATLAVCAQYCPLLETCVLTACALVTSSGVEALLLARGCGLRELHFGGCKQLGDAVIIATAQHCPLLCRVSLPQGVTDAAVVKLAEGCPQLTHLHARYAVATDAGLTALAIHCPQLLEVCLMGCSGLTAEGVRALVNSCTHLKTITLPTRFADQLRKLQTKSLRVHFQSC
jgi:hypothetical protein